MKGVKCVKCQCIETGVIVDGYLIGGRLYTYEAGLKDITDTHEMLPVGAVQMLKWVLASTIIILSAFAIYSPN